MTPSNTFVYKSNPCCILHSSTVPCKKEKDQYSICTISDLAVDKQVATERNMFLNTLLPYRKASTQYKYGSVGLDGALVLQWVIGK